MKPIWARKFEPAAVASDETQEAIDTLLALHIPNLYDIHEGIFPLSLPPRGGGAP